MPVVTMFLSLAINFSILVVSYLFVLVVVRELELLQGYSISVTVDGPQKFYGIVLLLRKLLSIHLWVIYN